MWSYLPLCLSVVVATASGQSIGHNSSAEAVKAAIVNGTLPFGLELISDTVPTLMAPVYKCLLVENVVADTMLIADDPKSAIKSQPMENNLKKRSWLDDTLLIITKDNPLFVPIITC